MSLLLLHPGRDLHDQWGPGLRWSVRSGRLEFPTVLKSVPESSPILLGVLFSSRAFLAVRWTMLGMILGEDALWRLYLAAKPSHVGDLGGWASLPPAPAYGPKL
jgi:hypothetical protein